MPQGNNVVTFVTRAQRAAAAQAADPFDFVAAIAELRHQWAAGRLRAPGAPAPARLPVIPAMPSFGAGPPKPRPPKP